MHLASDASESSVYARFIWDDKVMGTGELIFDADGNASSIYIYGNTIPIALDTFEKEVTVALFNDPSLGSETPIDTFVLEGTNAKLVKDSCSNMGIDDVEVKLAISDMYDVQHEVKPELEFDPAGGQWGDGTGGIRKFEAGLETSFDIIDAPTRDGYTFVCWEGSEYQPGERYLVDGDHAFTAKWKKNEGGGSGSSDSGGSGSGGSGSSSSGSGSSRSSSSGNTAKTGTSKLPKTGDPTNPMFWLLPLLVSCGMLAVAARELKREP
ncbi:MAG: InlB B-repeat-containing protein [Atopobiaceae bacterium]|nr:InlB B-repeat-containing protein [Atopobiaceae bacterium]